MASLNTLEVRGLSRFLNTIYTNDLTVNGTFGTSGNMSVGGTLAVTGNTTISGTLTLSKTQDLSGTANNSPALIVGGTTATLHMEIDNNEIQAKNDGTHVATLNINLDGGLVKIGSGGLEIAGALKATGTTTLGTANITTATVSTGNFTNVNVSNVLRAARYDLQTVGQLGGAFYVSPTIVFPNNETSITVTKNGAVLTITIVDPSITATDTMAGIVWNTNAKVKVSGKIGNIVTGTMDGTITSINTNSHTLVLSVSGENSSSVVAGSYTASNISDLCVMLYNMGSNFNDYPVGILLNSYGTNSKSYIDIYGGTSPETSPNVRIGNLDGLVFNDSRLSSQWGLYTTNGYFSGTINANLGKIAGWTISNSALTKISPAIDNVRYSAIMQAPLDEGIASSNVAFGVRTSTNNADWVYPFSVNYAGQLKTTNILATGGNIAGWAISSTSLSKDSSAINGTIYGAVLSAPTVSPTSIAYAVRNKASSASDWTDYPFVVKYDGSLKATNADISGKITATSGSISGSLVTSGINADNITAGIISVERLRSLEVGGRNLILKSSQSKTITLESATGSYYTDYYIESEYGKTITNGNITDYFTISYDWTSTSETGAAWLQFNGTSIGQIAYASGYKTSGTVEKNKVDFSEGSGRYVAVFKFTSAQANAATQAPRVRIDGATLAQTAGSTFTIYNLKLEKGNTVSAYTSAPEDTYTDITGTNLSPFFSHTLTDIYNASTNPNGYWIKNGANGWADKSQFTFTRLEDGWLHVHIDNSSGTGVIRNDCCCPRYNPIIKPNTKYTFLIEFRNNTSTNIGTNSNIYLVQQGGGVQFWGTNVPTGSAVKLEGVGDSNVINLSVVPTDGSYVFNRSTKLSLDTTDTYYGTNMMMTYVFRADTGAVLDYDIRISMYEGIYYGPYVPYKANNANYLYYDSTNGLILSENATGQTYNSASSGYNTQLKSDGLYIRNNSTVLAKYGTETTIGQDSKAHVTIGSSRMYFSDGDDSIFFAGDAANGATTRPVVLIMNTKSQDPAGGASDEFWIEHPDGYWSEYGETPIESITTVEAVSEDDSITSMVLPASQYSIEYTTKNGKNYLKKITVIDPNYDINSNDDYTPFWYTYPIIRITAVTSTPNIIYHMQEESESSIGNNKEAGYGIAESNSKALGLRSHAASGGTAIAPGSWAVGPGTVSEFPNSLVIGKYNKRGTRNIFTIGNGIDDTTGRSDAFSVSPEGVVTLKELQFNSTPAEIRREGNISDNIMVNDEYIDETDSDLAINVYKIGALVQVNLAFRNAYGQNIPQDTPIMYGFPKPLMPRTVRIGSNIERSNAVVLMINDDGELVSWWGQYIQTGNMVRIGFMYLAAEEW